jgi:hypothetical protein
MQVSGQYHTSAALLPGIKPITPTAGLGDLEKRKTFALPGLETPIAQPVQ